MGVMGCCQSKKNRDYNYDDDINQMTLEDFKGSTGGVFGQEVPGMSFKYQDAMMDKYIKEHLIDEPLQQVAGMLSFESFLKVYKCALVWNRVKFQKQKKELVAKRREALKVKDMTQYR